MSIITYKQLKARGNTVIEKFSIYDAHIIPTFYSKRTALVNLTRSVCTCVCEFIRRIYSLLNKVK